MPQGEAPRMVWNADSGQGWVLPDEEGRPPGKGTTAHRLAVVPCIGRRKRPFPIHAGKGRWGGLFNRPTGFLAVILI